MECSRHRRPFTWVDTVALLLATLLGLAMSKDVLDGYDQFSQAIGQPRIEGFARWGPGTVPLFVCWSLTLLTMRVGLRPRRRLMREPGIAPGVVIAILTVREVAAAVAGRYWSTIWVPPLTLWGPFSVLGWLGSWLPDVSQSAGFAVAAIWLVLGIGRWWRPEPSWIDRAGRALGVYWIAIFVMHSYKSLAS
jgi:hypothetical protein